MMGPTHRLLGTAGWLGIAVLARRSGQSFAVEDIPIGTGLTVVCSAGPFSPDADRTWLRFLKHRGFTHWWVATVIAAGAVVALLPWPHGLAVAAGWAGHVLGDAAFGTVPVWPKVWPKKRRGWYRAGLKLKTGGRFERWAARPVLALSIPVLAGTLVLIST